MGEGAAAGALFCGECRQFCGRCEAKRQATAGGRLVACCACCRGAVKVAAAVANGIDGHG